MKTMIKLVSTAALLVSVSACTAITDFTSSTSSTLDAVNKRYVAIRHDAANGGGEHITALAQLMGKQDTRDFARLMQANFDSIFTDVDQPAEIIARIEATSMQTNG